MKNPIREGHYLIGDMKNLIREGHYLIGDMKNPIEEGHYLIGDMKNPIGEGFYLIGVGYISIGEGLSPIGKGYYLINKGFYPIGEGLYPIGVGYNLIGEGLNPIGIGSSKLVQANAFAEYSILPSLKYKFNLGYTNSFGENTDYYKRHTTGTLFSHTTNDLAQSKDRNMLVLLENTLNYNQEFGKHNIQGLAGYAFQRVNYYYWNAAKTNLPDVIQVLDAGSGTATVNGNRSQSALLSVFGRVMYSYDNRYMFSASFRRDGSSRFGKNYRYGNYPSVSLGWNVFPLRK